MSEHRVLFVGLGELGSQVFDTVLRVPGKYRFLVAGRNVDFLRQRTNASLFATMQLGFFPEVSCVYLDVWNIDQTAETISRFRPDVIFCALTMQPWMTIAHLPPVAFEQLYPAMAGPWLPWSLVTVQKLMQAIEQTGLAINVINASYPDAINTILRRVNLAPTIGIGNLANNIPALRKSVALKLNVPLEHVEIRFIAAHYVSHKISRIGTAGGAPFHLTALVDGKDQTHLLKRDELFDLLPTLFKRSGKGAGHLVTAASASVVFNGIVNNTGVITHAPGPNGLPGGYPIQMNAEGIKLALPDGVTLDTAVQINEIGLRFDGIEKIEEDGTVIFTKEHMAVLKQTLGYACERMPLSETEYWARELQAKYGAFAKQHGT